MLDQMACQVHWVSLVQQAKKETLVRLVVWANEECLAK